MPKLMISDPNPFETLLALKYEGQWPKLMPRRSHRKYRAQRKKSHLPDRLPSAVFPVSNSAVDHI